MLTLTWNKVAVIHKEYTRCFIPTEAFELDRITVPPPSPVKQAETSHSYISLCSFYVITILSLFLFYCKRQELLPSIIFLLCLQLHSNMERKIQILGIMNYEMTVFKDYLTYIMKKHGCRCTVWAFYDEPLSQKLSGSSEKS